MKVNTYKTYTFTADLYNFTVTRDAEGGEIRTYSFVRAVSLHATSTGFGKLVLHFKAEDDDIVQYSRIHSLKSSDGVEIREFGVWEMAEVEPILNLWGRREGFKGRATLFALEG